MQSKQQTWQKEWQILDNHHEKYEQFALLIKLLSVIICCISIIYSLHLVVAILLLLTLWLQEGIWKTYQNRLADRILFVEMQLQLDNAPDLELLEMKSNENFQFYSSWQNSRMGTIGLVKEYLTNALRPTVIYPHGMLISINIFSAFLIY